MRFTTAELDWLLARLRTNEEAVQLARIETKVDALAGALTGSLGMIGGRLDALGGQEQQEITQMAEIDDRLSTVENAVAQVGNDVQAETDRLNALIAAGKPVTAEELSRLDAIATSLQNIDATAVAAGQPVVAPAPAPAGGDTTGGTDTTGGGDQTPVPVDGGAGDGSAPAPSDPTA